MKYSNKRDDIHVYLDQSKVYMGDAPHKIDKIYSKKEGRSKFSFGKYIVKIMNDKLSLCDSSTFNLIETYIRDDEYDDKHMSSNEYIENSTEEEWEKYIIKKDTYLSINVARTFIIINEVKYGILSIHKIGNCDVYVTLEGTIKLSDKTNTWNNVSIMKIV